MNLSFSIFIIQILSCFNEKKIDKKGEVITKDNYDSDFKQYSRQRRIERKHSEKYLLVFSRYFLFVLS